MWSTFQAKKTSWGMFLHGHFVTSPLTLNSSSTFLTGSPFLPSSANGGLSTQPKMTSP